MSKKKFYIFVFGLLTSIIALTYFLCVIISKEKDSQSSQQVLPHSIRLQSNQCSPEPENINITLITDSGYIGPTKVSMYSAIKTKCPSSIYNFYIIAENITLSDEQELLRLQNLSPDTVKVKIIPQKEPDLPFENMQRFLQYKVGMHKIYLPDTLPNLKKVLYMDGDTIVLKDLRNLYNIDVTDVYASVVKDGIYYRFPKEMAELGLDKRGYYFNSGVMLYNLELQRKDDIVTKMVNYVIENNDFYGDQDVLNIVFKDKLKLMSYRYNCISTFFEADDLNFLSQYYGEALPKDTFYIYENSTIIHYAGDKPWHEHYRPIFLKELWFNFYRQAKDI